MSSVRMLYTTDEESVCGAQLTLLTKDTTQAENSKKQGINTVCSFAVWPCNAVNSPEKIRSNNASHNRLALTINKIHVLVDA